MDTTARVPIEAMQSGQVIDQVFVISQPQLRTTSRGDHYIAAYLSDRTGKLNGRMWQASPELYEHLPQEGYIQVRGRTEMYQGSLQLIIEALRPVRESEIDPADFLPRTDKDIDAMFAAVREILATVTEPDLARLLGAFLADEKLMELFRQAPAAQGLHHAYIGGLLEHTLSVLELAVKVLGHYPQVDRDMVLAGLFLHDIGKTTELVYDVSFRYSDEGRLVSHVVKGAMLVQQKVDQLTAETGEAFPELVRDCVMHIILSHHGTREFGSPVLPATPEAFMVHHLDNLDSKVALTFSEIARDASPSSWTNYIRAIEGPLLKIRPDGTLR